jgi:hypothetical protein
MESTTMKNPQVGPLLDLSRQFGETNPSGNWRSGQEDFIIVRVGYALRSVTHIGMYV